MSIDNTSNLDPFLAVTVLMNAGSDASTAFITRMEAEGQRQIVGSDLLPTECDDDTALEALGFAFGAPLSDDPLFRPATLPDGWSCAAGTHDMYSYVVDEHWRRRVSVFYKAAFYDREASMSLVSVAAYVNQCVEQHVQPVTDDTWATPEALHLAATTGAEQRARWVRTARRDNEADLAREYDGELRQFRAIANRFAPSDGGVS
ncbi:hypothetical protein [Embleya sp. NPDC059237]|uniref:hypothetical protein n=1 Tax=Embleya sp. NPDC059237 TaxID=3346784 RepID=UPI003683A87C